jgi:hypothetical protein
VRGYTARRQHAQFHYRYNWRDTLGKDDSFACANLIVERGSAAQMKKAAIEKASAHLARARHATAVLAASRTFDRFEYAWGDFIAEYGRFLSKLETGSKADPKSRQWYGGLKKKHRADPLMSYLFQARNAAEHGLEDVTRRTADMGRIRFPATKTVKMGVMMRLNSDGSMDIKDPKVTTEDGEFTNLELLNPRVELVTVTDDRFPDQSWPPPETHFGSPIADRSPIGLAKLAIAEMEAVLSAAVQFVV